MKNLFFATAFSVALLCACSAERENPIPQPETGGAEVRITFDNESNQFDTRAFFDATTEAEPWENAIKTAVIYVADNQGTIVMRKALTAQEITSLSATIFLPQRVAGTDCTFYVAGNSISSAGNLLDESEMSKITDVTSNMNGAFESVSTGQRHSYGFPMTASKKVSVQPEGTPTNVSFVLKRAVAKIAVKVSVDEKFAGTLGNGSVFIQKITLLNASSRIWLFSMPAGTAIVADETLIQTPQLIGNDYCGLFYIPETVSGGDRVTLHITGIFDQDSNTFTTNDQIPVSWDITIEGSGGGEIRRNGYYRINAIICGFDALKDIHPFLSAAEWESPVTPATVNLY